MGQTLINARCVVSDEDCERNLTKVLARDLPYCIESPERADRLAIVAAGPSVTDFLDEIKEYEHIWAINGAYDFLLARGIVPNGFFGTDPLPGLAFYVNNIQPETTCYISALCDEAVFNLLKLIGANVKVWFPVQDNVKFATKIPHGAELIPGGTTAVTRAPFLARSLGFRNITIYGADSSYEPTGRYCYRDGTYPEDSKAEIKRVMINGEGPFYSELPLLMQIAQLGVMHTHQTWGVKFNIRCNGLMNAYLKAPLELDDGEIISTAP